MMRFNGVVSLLLIHCGLVAAAPLEPVDLGALGLANTIRLSDTTATAVVVGGAPALRLDFGSKGQYPSACFEVSRIGFSGDWSAKGALTVTVANVGTEEVSIGLRVDSRAAADRGRQATVVVGAGKEARLLMPLAKGATITGMVGQPPLAGAQEGDMNLAAGTAPFDASAITSFQLFCPKPKSKHTILLKRIELLEGKGPQMPFVDRFGQFNGASWPGKLRREAELAERREAETAALARLGALPDRDAFGGWAGGPALPATGRFRVQQFEGKWWLVDPEGRLFWSSGITGVRFNNATRVGGREDFFEWLPAPDDPLARFAGGGRAVRTFDFYAANLYRKYGADFASAFFDQGTRRLVSWGVNTIANWSDERAWALRRVPYTIPIHTGAASFVVTERQKAGKPFVRRFPDPFAPEFTAGLDEKLAALAPWRDDPWLLGVFIDNELPWVEGTPAHSAAAAALGLPVSAPIKAALLTRLRSTHQSIDAVNAAFGTRFTSWEEAGAPWKFAASAEAIADLDAFVAEQYFRTCREAMRRHLPGTLYLGCRFHVYNRPAIRAAGRYCDVVTFNIYAYHPSERAADELATEMGFPVMIGEFHFGATDRGMFHPGLRKAENQRDRADKYTAYLTEAAAAPWCVGAHWFQYLDQALTGRSDGENYNIGFVNATDDAYPELAQAAREFHAGLYPLRRGAKRQ
jgi:hypothetical protein